MREIKSHLKRMKADERFKDVLTFPTAVEEGEAGRTDEEFSSSALDFSKTMRLPMGGVSRAGDEEVSFEEESELAKYSLAYLIKKAQTENSMTEKHLTEDSKR